MDNLRKPDVITVLVNRADGGVTVLRVITAEYRPSTPEEIAAGSGPRVKNWSVEPTPDYIEAIIAKHDWPPPLRAVSWEIAPNDIVNEGTDRTFRGAWRANGKRIDVDMPKAREIQRERLRRMRAPLLEELDVDYMKAGELGNDAAQGLITTKKQALRDVTADPAIEAAQTPEELKAVVPGALHAR